MTQEEMKVLVQSLINAIENYADMAYFGLQHNGFEGMGDENRAEFFEIDDELSDAIELARLKFGLKENN